MTTKTKHPLAEVMQWIIDGEVVEQRSCSTPYPGVWHVLDVTENFSLFNNFEYRKKKKPPIVKYRWLIENLKHDKHDNYRYAVTAFPYADEKDYFKRNPDATGSVVLICRIESSKIEVEQ